MESEPAMYEDEAQTWSMLIHLSAFSLFFTGIGYLLAPLILWLLKKDDSPLVNKQGKEALNFQLTSTVYLIAAITLCFIYNKFSFFLYFMLIAWMVVVIQAAQAANEGRSYRYPFTLRLLR